MLIKYNFPAKLAVLAKIADTSNFLEGFEGLEGLENLDMSDVADATAAIADGIGATETVSWLNELGKMAWETLTAGRVISSLILFLICFLFTRLVLAIVKKITSKAKMDKRAGQYVVRVIKAALYLIDFLIVAGSLGVDVTSLIALASIFGLAVSLAIQDTLANLAGGMVILFAKPFSLGDYVATDDGEGTVEEIGLTHTKMDTYAGQRLMLPNSKLSAGKIVNYTVLGQRRADHTLRVSQTCHPDAVKAACLKAVAMTPDVLDDPAPQAVMTAYVDSGIEYHVRFWAEVDKFWDVNFAALENIDRVFRDENIEITYNQLYNRLNGHLMNEKNMKKSSYSKS